MPDPHPVPKQVGRYEIEGFLSQGGMGRLYLARDPVIGRRLAIKLIRDGIDDADLRARFMQEARAGGGLKHPNVVTVFDAGDHEGHPFIAMEYVSGETVADLIDRAEPISVARKLQLVEQLCRGLASAHREGLVHRDIKPSNLMVDDDGTLKILDFGIARVAESGLTSSGVAIGTVNYMSPEQAAGSTVDHRSDVFSVGSVFYELLAYQPAFPGSIQDGVLYRIVHGEPASLRDACPGLPTAVTDTVGRALRLNPAERYQIWTPWRSSSSPYARIWMRRAPRTRRRTTKKRCWRRRGSTWPQPSPGSGSAMKSIGAGDRVDVGSRHGGRARRTRRCGGSPPVELARPRPGPIESGNPGPLCWA